MSLCLQNLRSRSICVLFLLGLLPFSGAAVADDEHVLFDFEQRKLSVDWQAFGNLQARRDELNGPDSANIPPAGSGVWIKTGGNAGLFTKAERVDADWRKHQTLSFWVYRSQAQARTREQAIFEVQLREADLNAGFWRRVSVNHRGWKEIRLPLTWFRWRPGRIGRWDRIERLGFWFRDAAELTIDRIAVEESDESRTAFVSGKELQAIAFPDSDPNEVRRVESDEVEIVTNVPQLNTDQLMEHFAKVKKAFDESLPALEESAAKPVLVVFPTRKEYEEFAPKLAGRFAGGSPPPRSAGYTMLGVSMSYWDEQHGSLRPVYTHELTHGLISRRLRFQSGGGWIHEGIATLLQLRFHPQENFPQLVVEGLKSETLRSPLKELCNGQRVPSGRYWQAATIVECLLESPQYKDRFPKLLESMRSTGSTDLGPHLEILDTDWDKLTGDWKAYCEQTY